MDLVNGSPIRFGVIRPSANPPRTERKACLNPSDKSLLTNMNHLADSKPQFTGINNRAPSRESGCMFSPKCGLPCINDSAIGTPSHNINSQTVTPKTIITRLFVKVDSKVTKHHFFKDGKDLLKTLFFYILQSDLGLCDISKWSSNKLLHSNVILQNILATFVVLLYFL